MTPGAAWLRRNFELQDPQHARLLPMEGLRGVAVTLVFLQHYAVQAQLVGLSPGSTAVFASIARAYGNFGVELFFVLSGYLIYGTLVRRSPPFLGFMARRCQRIYPAFLVVFALALALTLLAPDQAKLPHEPWRAAAMIGANLALLPGLFPIPRIVDVAWSLSYEIFFYVVTAAVVLKAGMGRLPGRRRVRILLVCFGLFVLTCFAGPAGFPLRMMPFFAGMLLAEGEGGHVPAWLGWAAPALAIIAVALHILPETWNEIAQTAAFFALCAVCFRGKGVVSGWMTWAPLRWLGNMSYSYYLLHGFVVRIAMVMLARLLPNGMSDWMFWVAMLGLYVATLAASAVLFLWVERPLSLQPARLKTQAQPALP